LITVDFGNGRSMEFILWVLAVILVISGIVQIVRREVLYGVVLIIVGLLVGPGGVSVFT
jgi:NADH:ubiquinone oxidoreductase subunit 6 (subunit J)